MAHQDGEEKGRVYGFLSNGGGTITFRVALMALGALTLWLLQVFGSQMLSAQAQFGRQQARMAQSLATLAQQTSDTAKLAARRFRPYRRSRTPHRQFWKCGFQAAGTDFKRFWRSAGSPRGVERGRALPCGKGGRAFRFVFKKEESYADADRALWAGREMTATRPAFGFMGYDQSWLAIRYAATGVSRQSAGVR